MKNPSPRGSLGPRSQLQLQIPMQSRNWKISVHREPFWASLISRSHCWKADAFLCLRVHPWPALNDPSMSSPQSCNNLPRKCEEGGTRVLPHCPLSHGHSTCTRMWTPYCSVSQEEVTHKGFRDLTEENLTKGQFQNKSSWVKTELVSFWSNDFNSTF